MTNKNESGFSLVEVLISLLILSVVSLGYMYINKQGLKDFKNIVANDEINRVVNEIGHILSDPSNCKETLMYEDIFSVMKRNSNNEYIEVFKKGINIGNSLLKITNYKFSDEAEDVDLDKDSTAHLYITFDKGKFLNNTSITLPLKIFTEFKNNQLESCKTIGYNNQNKMEIFSDSNGSSSQFECSTTGKLRYNVNKDSLQVCGSDNYWNTIVKFCVPGSIKYCPSNDNVYRECTNNKTWGPISGTCNEWN